MAKTVSPYTPEIRIDMKASYTAATTESERKAIVKQFANKVATSEASVRAVMTRAGYYIKKVYKTKQGGEVQKKEELVGKIAVKIGFTEENAGSLAKANVAVLKGVLQTFGNYENDIKALTEGEPETE